MKGEDRDRIRALMPYLTETERAEMDLLLTEDNNRLIREIQNAKRDRRWGADVVEAYARIMLRTDSGDEIRPAAHHKLWLQLLCEPRIKKLFIVAPPESAKTTWAISAYLGAKVGFFPEWSWIVASVTETVAEKRTQSLRATVSSPEWQRIYPGMVRVPELKWEGREWSIAPGGRSLGGRIHPTMAAYGVGGSITGSRANEIVSDDILDRDNTKSQYQRDEIFDWWHNSLLSRRKSRVGRIVGIGTAWHDDDLYSRIRKTGDYVVCHTPLLSEGDDVYATLTYPTWWEGDMLGEAVSADQSVIGTISGQLIPA